MDFSNVDWTTKQKIGTPLLVSGNTTYKAIAVVIILTTVYDSAPCLHLLIRVLERKKE